MTRTELIEELRETAERITRYTNSPYDGLMSAAADMLEADGKLAAPAQPFQPDWVSYRQGVEDGKAEAQQPLTQPDKQRLWNDACYANRSSFTDAAMDYGSMIEAAHGIAGAKP
jgi:hypothetical protein